MREYFTLHRSVFPSYLTIESGRISLYIHCILLYYSILFCITLYYSIYTLCYSVLLYIYTVLLPSANRVTLHNIALLVRCWQRYAEGKMLLGQKIFASKMPAPVC